MGSPTPALLEERTKRLVWLPCTGGPTAFRCELGWGLGREGSPRVQLCMLWVWGH